ncbi:MAG: silent information regulator protein Sir2, partial [Bacteroides sp.]
MKQYLGLLTSLFLLSISIHAQDSRERNYYYENLDPRHEAKPEVKGFASVRIEERMNRGLIAARAKGGKGIYLSWRLLKDDDTSVKFAVYRSINGKIKKL